MDVSGHCTIRELVFFSNQDPDQHAIESPQLRPLTYRDLRTQVLYGVKTLIARGLDRNDRIAVITPAGPETAVAIISVMAGFTCVPLNPQSREQEFDRIFERLKVKAIIVGKGYGTAATEAAKKQDIGIIELLPLSGVAGRFTLEPSFTGTAAEDRFAMPEDISHIFLTSGTTDRPKVVPLSQKQTFLGRQKQAAALQFTSRDRCLSIVPYYHGMGLHTALLSVLLAGGTVISTRDFIPPDFLPLLRTFRPTCYVASPAHHQGILRELKKIPPHERQENSLRLIVSSSAAMEPGVSLDLEAALGVPVIEQYALSETGVIAINLPPKRGSVGIPVVDHIAIMGEEGAPEKTGEPGEIVVKGDTVFSGYEDATGSAEDAFVNGWFRTGDMGYLDADGYLFLTGRKKELINKGGEKISPEEIDTVLRSHPFVKDAMAFAITDPVLGEDIAAMVVPSHERVKEPDLYQYLLDRLVPFKVPRKIFIVASIPKTPTGKPRRQEGTRRYSPAPGQQER